MKKYRSFFVSFLVLFIVLIIFPFLVHAQGPSDPGFDPDAPIDGGLSLLIAAGIGYGVKKHRDNRKKKNAELI